MSDSDSNHFVMPIDGVLDLHAFQPSEVEDLVSEYLKECQERNILNVVIIHGKGTGVLKATVYSVLKKDPRVAAFKDASPIFGGWGRTEVVLHPLDKKTEL